MIDGYINVPDPVPKSYYKNPVVGMSIQKGKAVLTHIHIHEDHRRCQISANSTGDFLSHGGAQRLTKSVFYVFLGGTTMARPPQVTGGTGALGLVFAEWMASLGARPLAPLGGWSQGVREIRPTPQFRRAGWFDSLGFTMFYPLVN